MLVCTGSPARTFIHGFNMVTGFEELPETQPQMEAVFFLQPCLRSVLYSVGRDYHGTLPDSKGENMNFQLECLSHCKKNTWGGINMLYGHL